jgi:hypothetical protein
MYLREDIHSYIMQGPQRLRVSNGDHQCSRPVNRVSIIFGRTYETVLTPGEDAWNCDCGHHWTASLWDLGTVIVDRRSLIITGTIRNMLEGNGKYLPKDREGGHEKGLARSGEPGRPVYARPWNARSLAAL